MSGNGRAVNTVLVVLAPNSSRVHVRYRLSHGSNLAAAASLGQIKHKSAGCNSEVEVITFILNSSVGGAYTQNWAE